MTYDQMLALSVIKYKLQRLDKLETEIFSNYFNTVWGHYRLTKLFAYDLKLFKQARNIKG